MPYNPFPDLYTTLQGQADQVDLNWTDAELQLGGAGAPDTTFLDLAWSGGKIIRIYDGQQVSTLTEAQKAVLHPHLYGLFKKAINAALLP